MKTFPQSSDLTWFCEFDKTALRPHCPGPVSGVTIGPGYDMGRRDPMRVREDLVEAGVDPDIARELSAACGMVGSRAAEWVSRNRQFAITEEQARRLFEIIYPSYVCKMRRIVAAWGGNWFSLSNAAQELLTDLAYRGDLAERHHKHLQPVIEESKQENPSTALLKNAICDTGYWSRTTNLRPDKHGRPNGRFVARADFARKFL